MKAGPAPPAAPANGRWSPALGLERRILLLLSAVVATLLLVDGMLAIARHRKDLQEQLAAWVEMLATIQAGALATALYDFDDDKAFALFTALDVEPSLAHARLYDADGKLRWHLGRRDPWPGDLRVRRPILSRQEDPPVPLGELELFVSTSRLEAAARGEVVQRAALLALTLVAVLGMIAVGLRRIAAPLDQIAGVVTRLARGEHGLEVPGRERPDEVGRVARALEVLRVTVEEAERLRGDEARSARAALARIRAAVESASDPIAIFEPSGAAAFVNRAAERLFGPLCRTQGRRGSLARLLPDRTARRALLEALRARGAFAAEVELLAGSARRSVELRVDRILTPEGTPAGFVAIASDVSERRAIEARILHLAHHDALTGLPNRAMFRERVEQAVARADASGERLALVLVDLDRFKEVNDSLGHPAGDALLCAAAERLRRAAPTGALVARLGGDEFAVLLSSIANLETVGETARRIVATMAEPFGLLGRTVRCGATLGIAVLPDHATTPGGLLQNADIALYRAKSDGRGRLRFFDPEIARELHEARELEADLHEALARGELELYYQPRREIASGRLVGAEALLRWRHPTRGFVSPSRFVPIAEEHGLILPIGEWVLDAVVAQAARWARNANGPARVSFNLSPVELREADVPARIDEALRRHGLPPDRLEVEITEGVLLSDRSGSIAALERIRDLGVSIALDDFGTGYASLSYLRRFRLDRLKLDRSFVCDLEQDASARAIARTVIELGHSLGMRVTAEGVETAGQLDCLARLGCDEAQGFFTGHPVAAAALGSDEQPWADRRPRRQPVAERPRKLACDVVPAPP